MREGTTWQRVWVSSLREKHPQRTASKVVGPQSYSHREQSPACHLNELPHRASK